MLVSTTSLRLNMALLAECGRSFDSQTINMAPLRVIRFCYTLRNEKRFHSLQSATIADDLTIAQQFTAGNDENTKRVRETEREPS